VVQYYGLLLLASISATAILTLLVFRLALNRNIVDRPGLHKTHHDAIPLLGGLAIFMGIAVVILASINLSDKMLSILLGAIILVVTGLLDDIYHIKPLVKLSGQTLAATFVILSTTSQYGIFYRAFQILNLHEYLALFLLVGWVVLMINAFNLIDGLDGLAAGTGAIIFSAMALITLLNGGSTNMLAVQVIGAGACIGFLFFNFNPAKIFMGDTGSMLIGYLLAVTYLISLNSEFSGSLILGSFFIFAYPALDVTYAILRRIRHRTSIFRADKGHLHHILISLGFSVRKTVILIYLANIFFAALAIFLLSSRLSSLSIIMIGFLTAVCSFLLMRFLAILSRKNGLNAIEKTK